MPLPVETEPTIQDASPDIETEISPTIMPDLTHLSAATLAGILGLRDLSSAAQPEMSIQAKAAHLIDRFRTSIETPPLFRDKDDYVAREKERIDYRLAHLSIVDKVKRSALIFQVRRGGFQRSEHLVSLLEHNILIGNYSNIRSHHLLRLTKGLDENDEDIVLQKLGLAFERFKALDQIVQFYQLENPEFVEMAKTLANTSKEDFQKIVTQLNPYFFINIGYFGGHLGGSETLSLEASALAGIIQNNGLTVDQKGLLDKHYLFYMATHKHPALPSDENREFTHSIQLDEALNPDLAQNLSKYLPNVVDFAYWRSQAPAYQENLKSPLIDYWFLESLEYFDKKGQLQNLKDLMEKGWELSFFYMDIEDAWNQEKKEEAALLIEKAAQFSADADKVAWASIFQQVFFGSQKLDPKKVDLYEAMYERRADLQYLALYINALPKVEGLNFNIFSADQGKLNLNFRAFSDILRDLVNNTQIPDFEKKLITQFVAIINNVLRTGDFQSGYGLIIDEDLPLMGYLAVNKNRLGILFNQYMAPRAKLIEELLTNNIPLNINTQNYLLQFCADVENLPPKLAWQYLQFFGPQKISTILAKLPDEFIATLSPKELQFLELTKNLDDRGKSFLVIHRDQFDQLVQNGHATPLLIEGLIAEKIYSIDAILTEQNLDALPADQRQFWTAFKNLPWMLRDLLIDVRVEYDQYFINGIPGPKFLLEVASKQPNQFELALSKADLESFPADEKNFWQYYKKSHFNMRQFLLSAKDRFSTLVVKGKPTYAFLEEISKDNDLTVIYNVLTEINFNLIPKERQPFWQYYKQSLPVETSVMYFLLEVKDDFNQLTENGQPTPAFLQRAQQSGNNLYVIAGILKTINLENFPAEEKVFWEYYKEKIEDAHENRELAEFLLRHKDNFSHLFADGKETPLFYQQLAKENPKLFIQLANRQSWIWVYGQEKINNFLNILPEITDEKRNAFTHNKYDRTSLFLEYMVSNAGEEFSLTEDFEIVTEYIKNFGFSKTPNLFHYFKHLFLHEQNPNYQLPYDIAQIGVTSVEQLSVRLNSLKDLIYSEKPLTDLSTLSEFEIQMLKFITGKSTHRFDSGRPSMESIIQQFQQDLSESLIAQLPEGYKTMVIDASNITIDFDKEGIREDYEILKQEILSSIENPNDAQSIKSALTEIIQRKIVEISRIVATSEGKKQEFVIKEQQKFQQYLEKLSDIDNLNELTRSLLEINFDKTEQKGVNSVIRRIIFSKIFQKHYSEAFIQEVQRQLQGDISAASIQTIINIVDEMGKIHVLNLNGDNKEGYWDQQTFDALKNSKKGRNLFEAFSPHINKLKEEVKRFQKIQAGSSRKIRAIPDRGLAGEMSGYLADVCYTAEYPLLRKWPNVIPYKFVTGDKEAGDLTFIGSILVFEVESKDGKPALLVRAMDIPHESEIDISAFIEKFLDGLEETGRIRGKQEIYVPGDSGSISNYQMTINHIRGNYVNGKTPVSLKDRFVFNSYDLTNDCYVARKIAA